ncbi:ead/Ea22-like family protein [Salmonella enterica]|nr:ead/Ea22-like family protein [Salmonella enterica]
MNIDKQALRERYSPQPVPKCRICGDEMTVQRIYGSHITYGCTGATYDDKGCHYAEGRSIADDHYAQSRVTVVDVSDPDVLAQLDDLEAAERRIAELEARAFNPAILDVIAERQRQQSVEGWTPEHDDEHCNGELAMAAVCYINDTGTVNRNGGKPWGWPWDASWWKPDTRRRNLVKAGALILAEIERIDRAAGIKVKGE